MTTDLGLRVFAPDTDTSTRKDTPAASEPHPIPLLYEMIEQRTGEGSYHTDVIRVFRNEDGARCDICPLGECNFRPNPSGFGSCVKRRPGRSSRAPLTLGARRD